ncbi:PH domain-containing protein [Bacillus mycoides]|uniref:PH domain-containing protein n=1 Tax=Bacillus mycoides TaxID=1405 RepID=UPI003D65E323
MIKQDLLYENELVKNYIQAYYKNQSGLSILAGNVFNSPNIPGTLVATNMRMFFYTEVMKVNKVLIEIDYEEIMKINEKKQSIGMLKTIPSIVVHHKEEEIFSTMGDLEAFSKLKSFFSVIPVNK